MVLTESERKRKEAATYIVKTLSKESSVVERPLCKVDVLNIPNSVEAAVRTWIRKHKGKHEVYGSAAMATQSFIARQPNDLDIVVENPRGTSQALTRILRAKKLKTKTISKPKWNSYAIQIQDKKGEYKTALDIHPIKEHTKKFDLYGKSVPPKARRGISLQSAGDQLLRKGNAITQSSKEGMGASPHRNVKDTTDFIATAKALLSSMELRSAAKRAKAVKLRAAIRTWESHLRILKKGKTTKRESLTKTQKKKYVKKAVEQPDYAIEDLIFESKDKVVRRRKPIKKAKLKKKKHKRANTIMTIDEAMGKNLGVFKW